MKFKENLAVGLLCGILGFIIALQFNTVKHITNRGFLSTQEVQELISEFKNLRDEKEKLNEELANLEKELNEKLYRDDENLITKYLKDDLEKYQLLAGYRTGEGPGVIVTIDKLKNNFIVEEEDTSITYSDEIDIIIMTIINILNGAGAEAISINDQRYISTTEIFLTTNTLLINSVPTRPPFIIKAIGNSKTLEEALNIKYGIVWDLRNNWNFKVNVEQGNNIIMPRYNKLIKYEYAKPIELIQ